MTRGAPFLNHVGTTCCKSLTSPLATVVSHIALTYQVILPAHEPNSARHSYFATNLQDPYDFSKSWSIEGEEQRLAATLGYHGDPDAADTEGSAAAAAAAAAGGMVTNELYVYDNCVLAADGKPVVNGACKGVDWLPEPYIVDECLA